MWKGEAEPLCNENRCDFVPWKSVGTNGGCDFFLPLSQRLHCFFGSILLFFFSMSPRRKIRYSRPHAWSERQWLLCTGCRSTDGLTRHTSPLLFCKSPLTQQPVHAAAALENTHNRQFAAYRILATVTLIVRKTNVSLIELVYYNYSIYSLHALLLCRTNTTSHHSLLM